MRHIFNYSDFTLYISVCIVEHQYYISMTTIERGKRKMATQP